MNHSAKFLLPTLTFFFVFSATLAQTQTYSVLYSFTGSPDGAYPNAGVIMDGSGNLYGTTGGGGTSYVGTVFQLAPSGKETVLYTFQGSPDGAEPSSALIRDREGNLYGTTPYGGDNSCAFGFCGTVFEVNSSGKETVLYNFCSESNCADGEIPQASLVRDSKGNLYGTTEYGGDIDCFSPYGCGIVFVLNPKGKETVIHSFQGSPDGAIPVDGLVADAMGNGYGTTSGGGTVVEDVCSGGCGLVFEVSSSGTETLLYSFKGSASNDGSEPDAAVVLDATGNIYGTTFNGGDTGTECGGAGCGTLFRLNTAGEETVLYNFTGAAGTGSHPYGGLIMDKNGNLYGTAAWGGGTGCAPYGCGMVFELKKNGKLIVLHSFTGGADGGLPYGTLIKDAKGSLYGTAEVGGDLNCGGGGQEPPGCGVVFKIAP